MARIRALPELPGFSGTRYRLLGELDRGGMGVVYAAEDLTLGREVAIKVLRDGLARDGAEGRLERESTLMAGLEHPGIVPVHDAGTLPDGRAWYVLKIVRGARVDALAPSGLSFAEGCACSRGSASQSPSRTRAASFIAISSPRTRVRRGDRHGLGRREGPRAP